VQQIVCGQPINTYYGQLEMIMLLVAASLYIWPLLSPASTQEELPRKGSERLADAARIVTRVSRGSSTGTETPWYCQFQTLHYTKDSLVFSVGSEPTRHFRGYIEYHCTSTSVTETSAAISVNTLPPYAHQLKIDKYDCMPVIITHTTTYIPTHWRTRQFANWFTN